MKNPNSKSEIAKRRKALRKPHKPEQVIIKFEADTRQLKVAQKELLKLEAIFDRVKKKIKSL